MIVRNPESSFRRTRGSQFESLEARLPMAGDIVGMYGQQAEVFDLFTERSSPKRFHYGARIHASDMHQGELHYLLSKDNGDIELWKTDATQAGTQKIRVIAANQKSSPNPNAGLNWSMRSVGERLFFTIDMPNPPWPAIRVSWPTCDKEARGCHAAACRCDAR